MFDKFFFLFGMICLCSARALETGGLFDDFSLYENFEEYKAKYIAHILSDPMRLRDPTYEWERALATMTEEDADFIPKVPGAGQIFTEGDITYQLMHNGVKIIEKSYYHLQWLTDVIYALRGHHEPSEEKAFFEVLKHIPKNGLMLELGSYWAYYSLWFAFCIEGAKNILIEPDTERLNIGKINFQINHKEGDFFQGYVAIRDNDSADFSNASRVLIDDFLKMRNIDHVDILHSDIQGAELEMLKSCAETIKDQKIDYFFISTHGGGIHRACLKFLIDNDYQVIAEMMPYLDDGLIVAKSKKVAGPEYIDIKRVPFTTNFSKKWVKH